MIPCEKCNLQIIPCKTYNKSFLNKTILKGGGPWALLYFFLEFYTYEINAVWYYYPGDCLHCSRHGSTCKIKNWVLLEYETSWLKSCDLVLGQSYWTIRMKHWSNVIINFESCWLFFRTTVEFFTFHFYFGHKNDYCWACKSVICCFGRLKNLEHSPHHWTKALSRPKQQITDLHAQQ